MAISTTSGISSKLLSFELAQEIDTSYSKLVLLPHCNTASLAGAPTKTKRVAVRTNLGPASSGTEGTALTTPTTVSFGSPVDFTVSELALTYYELTRDRIQRELGLTDDPLDIVEGSDLAAKLAMLQPYYNQAWGQCRDKYEQSALASFASFSEAVGTTTEALDEIDLLEALLLMKRARLPHENWALFLGAQQVYDLQTRVMASDASRGWWSADTSFLNKRPDASREGLQGSVLGLPVYEPDEALMTTANTGADLVGALIARGVGDVGPTTPLQNMGSVLAVFGSDLMATAQAGDLARSVRLVVSQPGAVGAISTGWGVKIVTRATL